MTFSTGGTASSSDYTTFGTTAVIPAGSTVWPITVAITDDNLVENSETLNVSLQLSTSNAAINALGGFSDAASNTILDNDGTASASVAASVATIVEGIGSGFVITLSSLSIVRRPSPTAWWDHLA